MSGPNQLSSVTSAPSVSVDPALGLPQVVVKEKRWEALVQLIAGVVLVPASVLIILSGINGTAKAGWQLGFVLLVIAPFLAVFGWKRLKRGSCVVIAQYGFDDRAGTVPAGPVLWREVNSMGTRSDTIVRANSIFVGARKRKQLVIELKPGPRKPLSSLGPAPQQTEKVRITLESMDGGDKRLPDLMWKAWQQWRREQEQTASS